MKQEIRIFYVYACLSYERCQSLSFKKKKSDTTARWLFRISMKTWGNVPSTLQSGEKLWLLQAPGNTCNKWDS